MFMSESESIRIDNRMNEPVQVVKHPLISNDSMNCPQSLSRTDPFPGMDTYVQKAKKSFDSFLKRLLGLQ